MNKKGNIADWFFIIAILFIVSICIITVWMILNNPGIVKLFADNNVDMTNGRKGILVFDNIFIFMIVGLSIFVLISSALVYNHPALFIFSFFLLCVAVSFAAMISNTFYDITNMTYFTDSLTAFPKIIFLMNHLPIYIGFMGIAMLVAMFVGYTNQ